MASLLDDIRSGFMRRHGVVAQLIVVNVAVFLALALLNLIGWLAQLGTFNELFYRWLGLPAHLPTLATRPWTLFTYMFVHNLSDIFHLLFNMLWLYWIGAIILRDFVADRRILGLFIMGGIGGGLLYLLAYNLLPVLRSAMPIATLFGASAGVLAIVVGTATLLPNFQIGMLFFGLVRLKWLALVMVLLDLLFIPYGNAGGMIAHLGGALIGLLYMSSYANGADWLKPLDSLFEGFKPKDRSEKFVKVSARGVGQARASGGAIEKPTQAEVDRILEKIKAVGYDRLTKEEKQTLFNASTD